MGSFYNVVGDRLPNNKSIISPPSHCENCNHKLGGLELIPIFSFLLQGGKCKNCKIKLSIVYPLYEVVVGIAFAVCYMVFGISLELLYALTFVSILLIIIVLLQSGKAESAAQIMSGGKSDLFSNIKETFDVIVSNPPYIPIKEKENLQKEVLFDPDLALSAPDNDGVYFYKKIIENAKNHLKENGYVLFELGIGQSKLVEDILKENNFKNIEIVKDLAGIERVIIGQA